MADVQSCKTHDIFHGINAGDRTETTLRPIAQSSLALVLAFALGGCAGRMGASDAEGQALTEVHMNCMHNAAKRLDDGVSDVLGVALAVKASCNTEFNNLVAGATRGGTYYTEQRFRDGMESHRLGWAAEIVMMIRSSKTR